jgi:hypothetical protein
VLVNFADIGGDTGAHVKKSCMGLGFRRRGRLLRGWFSGGSNSARGDADQEPVPRHGSAVNMVAQLPLFL